MQTFKKYGKYEITSLAALKGEAGTIFTGDYAEVRTKVGNTTLARSYGQIITGEFSPCLFLGVDPGRTQNAQLLVYQFANEDGLFYMSQHTSDHLRFRLVRGGQQFLQDRENQPVVSMKVSPDGSWDDYIGILNPYWMPEHLELLYPDAYLPRLEEIRKIKDYVTKTRSNENRAGYF